MKKIMFLLGLLSALLGLFMVASAPYTIATASKDSSILDSEVDKVFYFLMIAGCGVVFVTTSVCLLKNWNPLKHRSVLYVGMVAAYAFVAGIYYHGIFGSPW